MRQAWGSDPEAWEGCTYCGGQGCSECDPELVQREDDEGYSDQHDADCPCYDEGGEA